MAKIPSSQMSNQGDLADIWVVSAEPIVEDSKSGDGSRFVRFRFEDSRGGDKQWIMPIQADLNVKNGNNEFGIVPFKKKYADTPKDERTPEQHRLSINYGLLAKFQEASGVQVDWSDDGTDLVNASEFTGKMVGVRLSPRKDKPQFMNPVDFYGLATLPSFEKAKAPVRTTEAYKAALANKPAKGASA